MQWILASFAGWLLGVLLVILLDELQVSFVGGNWVYLGAGMGWAVGFAQWWTARKWFGATSRWMWASTIGITTPFLLADFARMSEPNSLVLASLAACGGLLAGALQRSALRSHSSTANLWPLLSAVAWMCPALLLKLLLVPGHPQGALEALRNIGSVVFGGVILGTITGLGLIFLLKPPKAQSR